MLIENISNENLFYDNSLKKIISKIKYDNKNIVIKLEDIQIIKLENNILFIKNSEKIKNILISVNNILQTKFKINNFIFQNDLNNEILEFDCFIQKLNKKKSNDIILFLSHLELITKKICVKCYVINIL